MEKGTVKDALGKAKAVSSHAASKVATKAVDAAMAAKSTVTSATDKISSEIASRKEAKAVSQQDQYDNGMKEIKDTEAEAFLTALGKSPISLTAKQVEKIQKTFPIPKEQIILWADAEFDLRPSGIICTQKGVFIRSNIDFFGKKKQDRDGKSILYYYRWDNFDPGWFVGEEKEDNVALTVEEPCSQQFVQTCRSFTAEEKKVESQGEEVFVNPHKQANDTVKASFTVWVGNHQNQDAIFAEQKANRNNKAGHGEMAEEANTILDRLHGKNAKTVGRDNRKNGPDRRIGKDLFIQSKYYKTARGSLESAFDSGTGLYRYMQNGKPMQLEVPKDQYQQVLKGFEQKIRDHKVPGVTDPAQASQFVRKGRLTYQQAVNLTKPGTIESLAYDAITGVVTCSCAFGLTFVVTTFLTWRETRDMKQAALAGISAGGQVFGISFVQHVLISQLSRTRLADILLKPSQFVVNKLGTHTTANLVNGIRALSGKGAIYGAAAASNLAKILRGNALTSAISYAAFSIPATYRLMSKKISAAQYTKNITVLAGSVAGGTAGTVAAGIVAAKIAGGAGTVVAPGVGTAIGIAGGFLGGTLGAGAISIVGNVLHEDDIETYSRLFNAMVSCLASEYLLSGVEMDQLVHNLDAIPSKELQKFIQKLYTVQEQEKEIRGFLTPYFEKIVCQRERFLLPTADELEGAVEEILQ